MDQIYFEFIKPIFEAMGWLLEMILIRPMLFFHFPIWLQVVVIAILVALCSFFLRYLLRVDDKARRFNEQFAEQRRQQRNLRLISDKYSRDALYRVTDGELNERYNSFLAYHYARYVIIYMLPIFLVLGWLNSIYSAAILGGSFVVIVPDNQFGIQGFSVSFIFLLIYVISLVVGFALRRRNHRMAKHQTPPN